MANGHNHGKESIARADSPGTECNAGSCFPGAGKEHHHAVVVPVQGYQAARVQGHARHQAAGRVLVPSARARKWSSACIPSRPGAGRGYG